MFQGAKCSFLRVRTLISVVRCVPCGSPANCAGHPHTASSPKVLRVTRTAYCDWHRMCTCELDLDIMRVTCRSCWSPAKTAQCFEKDVEARMLPSLEDLKQRTLLF